jgi:hypothetical protein
LCGIVQSILDLTLAGADHTIPTRTGLCGNIEREQEALNMAIWDFRPKGDLFTGVAVGVGVLAAPVVVPLAWSAVRPLLKEILKGGFLMYETGRQVFGQAEPEVTTKEPGKDVAVTKVELPAAAIHQTERVLSPKGGRKVTSEKAKPRTKTGMKKPEKEK